MDASVSQPCRPLYPQLPAMPFTSNFTIYQRIGDDVLEHGAPGYNARDRNPARRCEPIYEQDPFFGGCYG